MKWNSLNLGMAVFIFGLGILGSIQYLLTGDIIIALTTAVQFALAGFQVWVAGR